jgi:pyridoxal phosphate enzyme (YggS family)
MTPSSIATDATDATAAAARRSALLQRVENAARAAGRPVPELLAVSKTQPATAVAALAATGQQAFGENYVQEARAKQSALAGTTRGLRWHLIGHLQSNKAAAAARAFDWVESVDRVSLVRALAQHRPADLPPLNVLVQVNVDDEPGKSGCRPGDLPALAAAIAAQPHLALRGLMAIPAPHADAAAHRPAFARMRALFEALRTAHPGVDTLSLGMSDDFEAAIAEGSTRIRIGTALFGPRTGLPRH